MALCATLVYHFAVYSRNEVESELVRTASDHSRLIDQFLRERASDLRFASAIHDRDSLSNEARLAEVLKTLQSGSGAFVDLGVIDHDGDHLAYVGPYALADKNYADTEWFKAVQQSGLYVSDVFLGYRNIPHFILAVRHEDDNGPWYLRATIDTLYFTNLVRRIHIGQTGEAYLITRTGVLQSEPRAGGRLMEQDRDYGLYRIDEGVTPSFSTGERFGERCLYATAPLGFVDWVLVVRQHRADAYAHLSRAALVAILVTITGGTVVVLMAFVLASSLAHQLSLADIERREMRTQLIIAGRLAEVGEMSAGFAHEINNPLQVMKAEQAMLTEILSELETDGSCSNATALGALKDSVGQLDVQIERCRRITHGLLKFARQHEPSQEPVAIQGLLTQVARMIERRANEENVRIEEEYDPALPTLISDPNQLQQGFLNLLNNALDAMKSKAGGTIRLTAARDGESHVSVAVADEGSGIAGEHLDKIFHPFFTTKPVGEGTGLGLSTVYGIVEGLGGNITVSSELGNGTVFVIRLPAERLGDTKHATAATVR